MKKLHLPQYQDNYILYFKRHLFEILDLLFKSMLPGYLTFLLFTVGGLL